MTDLLPPDALRGQRIGVSVSQSPDLDRLGLRETHFRLAVAEIARAILVAGGTLAYGGHLDPEGYTSFMVQELQRYSRTDQPLRVCLAWQEHRRLLLSELRRRQRGLRPDRPDRLPRRPRPAAAGPGRGPVRGAAGRRGDR